MLYDDASQSALTEMLHTSSNGFNRPPDFSNLMTLDRNLAAITPRWSRAIVFAALLSL